MKLNRIPNQTVIIVVTFYIKTFKECASITDYNQLYSNIITDINNKATIRYILQVNNKKMCLLLHATYHW